MVTIRYQVIFSKDPGQLINYYQEILEFINHGRVKYGKTIEGIKLTKGSDCTLLIQQALQEGPPISLIFNIADCLKEFYQLKEKGVVFLSDPVYTEQGLAVSFLDIEGNSITLFEEREKDDEFPVKKRKR